MALENIEEAGNFDEEEKDVFDYCEDGDLDTIKKYLIEGFKVETKNYRGETLLNMASYHKHIHIVKFLIEECKVNINTNDKEGFTPLMNTSTRGGDVDIFMFLLKNGANVHSENFNKNTVLMFESRNGNKNLIELLVNTYGANIDHKNWIGLTPLIFASCVNQYDSIKFLLESGADYKIKTDEGYTMIDYLNEDLLLKVTKFIENLEIVNIKPAKR
jgi:ankyrin repeat protein